ncbi:MAG: phytanoyl-CoA dioxygenase family protein [Acidimicrobiia bacterium]|nr:phytanoyl-CoA dioxygenase family protein [Acidimicrobiia bacterium]
MTPHPPTTTTATQADPIPDTAAQRRDQRLMAEADALVAEGRAGDAVRLLTEENRRRAHPRLEQRLVRLRHDAFEELEPSAGRASWPPEVPDCFEGVDGLVSVDAADLDAATLGAGIQHHGALWVRGLFTSERVEQLVEDIDRAFEAHESHRNGTPTAKTIPWFAPFRSSEAYSVGFGRQWVVDGGGLWTVDSPRAMWDLLEAFDEIGLDEVLTEYLGERPALSVKKCTLRRVPVALGGADWHQDGSFLGEGIRTVNVWLALSDCGVDAPGLDVVPKRFDEVLPTGTDGANFDWSVGPGMVEQVSADAPVVRPSFAAGDAVLFDELFLHRTGISPDMSRDRYAIESWFFAPSTYPLHQVPVMF